MSDSSLPAGSTPGSAHPTFGGLHPAVLAVRTEAINTVLAEARSAFDMGDMTSARILVKEAQAAVIALRQSARREADVMGAAVELEAARVERHTPTGSMPPMSNSGGDRGGYDAHFEDHQRQVKALPLRVRAKQSFSWGRVAGLAALVAFVVLIALLAGPPKANAAGVGERFKWHAELTRSVTSRDWTSSRRADVGITSSLGPCVGPNPVRYRVELWRDRSWWQGPVRAGFRDFTCRGTAVFRGQPAGTYRFQILVAVPTRSAGPFEADGVVAYGGARLRGAR